MSEYQEIIVSTMSQIKSLIVELKRQLSTAPYDDISIELNSEFGVKVTMCQNSIVLFDSINALI